MKNRHIVRLDFREPIKYNAKKINKFIYIERALKQSAKKKFERGIENDFMSQ